MKRQDAVRCCGPLIAVAITALAAACSEVAGRPALWTFAELLAPPSKSEISAVDVAWRAKNLDAEAVTVVDLDPICFGPTCYVARAITHRLLGESRCGLVFVPSSAGTRSLAGIVDVRDVSWDYPPRDVTNGPFLVTRILREDAPHFAVVMPCLRGGILAVRGGSYSADGDQTEAWEGAAEDSISFLTAALQTTPEIDPNRVAVYGYSRGGGVALIHGERDSRIRAVLAFAPPTDFFSEMGRPGVDWPARMDAARADSGAPPNSREMQFLDWLVRRRGGESLSSVRRVVLGASPRFFVHHLPRTQIHHGRDDTAVPVGNAEAVAREAVRLGRATKVEVFTYPAEGHLLSTDAPYTRARTFLRAELAGR